MDESMEHLKYHYMDKKIIEVKMTEKVNLDDIDGIKVLKDKEYNLKLEIDTNKKTVIDALNLIDTTKIVDINISNTPLEEIIAGIYNDVKKYLYIIKMVILEKMQYILNILTGMISYTILIFIFLNLWKYMYDGKDLIAGYTFMQMAWYVAVTEII